MITGSSLDVRYLRSHEASKSEFQVFQLPQVQIILGFLPRHYPSFKIKFRTAWYFLKNQDKGYHESVPHKCNDFRYNHTLSTSCKPLMTASVIYAYLYPPLVKTHIKDDEMAQDYLFHTGNVEDKQLLTWFSVWA